MNPQPMQLSDAEYFCKLEEMVKNSREIIQKAFLDRWKKEIGKEWEHTEQQGKVFIKGLGKDAYDKAEPIQKIKIAKGSVNDWDICLLSLVLKNFGSRNTYASENKSVQRLTSLRNGLAHHLSRKLSQQDYQGKVNVFRKSLTELGVKDEEIEQMITNSGINRSDAAFKMAKRYYDKAKKQMSKNEFDKAIEHCNEAMALPHLLPVQLAVTYENRADCYLKFAVYKRSIRETNQSNLYLDQAILDANKALEHKENSWKAHYVIGRCRRVRDEFKIAIKHLTLAIAISPVQEVKIELDACTYDFKVQSNSVYLNPDTLPMTLVERMAEHEAQTGQKVTKKQFLRHLKETKVRQEALYKGQADVLRGDDYRGGVGVTPNDAEAVRCYTKAAQAGNPEGMVELGDCLLSGTGGKRDPKRAVEYFRRAANMPVNTPGRFRLGYAGKNVGVIRGQFMMGVIYDEGIVVERDYTEAVRWYIKAVDNGSSYSATNLGNLYQKRLGSENQKMAEHYWYLALLRGDLYGAKHLLRHYKSHQEPEKAEAMFKMTRNLDPLDFDPTKDERFRAELEEVVKVRDKDMAQVVAFEKEHNLETKGLTFFERFIRTKHFCVSEPMMDKLNRVHDELLKEYNETVNDSMESESIEDLKTLRLHAKEGSVAAARMLEITGNLIYFMDGKKCFSNKQKTTVLNKLYECATSEFRFKHFKEEVRRHMVAFIDELFESKQGKRDEEEMKIRFVYICLNYPSGSMDKTDSLAGELVKQGIKAYPNNVHYYILLGRHVQDSKSVLPYIDKGLEKYPDNVELIFSKAVILRNKLLSTCRTTCPCCRGDLDQEVKDTCTASNKRAVIEAYQQFLDKASKIDPKVVEAYYNIAMVHMVISSDSELMKRYYDLGKEAENQMSSCYAEEISVAKSFVERILSEESKTETVGVGMQLEAKPDVAGILKRKMYLDSPVRRWMITDHRGRVNELLKGKLLKCPTYEFIQKLMIKTTPERIQQVKPITIRELNPVVAHLYEDQVLDLTIIDVPIINCDCPGIHLLVEDEYGDVARLNIYNLKMDEEFMQEELGLGVKLAILNPYMQTGIRHPNDLGIRVDDPDCIIYLGKVENMCRFCGDSVKAAPPLKCVNCRKTEAFYCSKECQEHDWKTMKHKLICSK